MPNRSNLARLGKSRVILAAMLVATASVAAMPATLGAATAAQTCTGPASTDQAGRQTFAPGINDLATVQTVTSKVHLFHCTGAPTGGAGVLRTTLKTTAVTCTVFSTAHVWKATATISWQNLATSTATISFATSGKTRKAQMTGTVTAGLFAGHSLTAEFKWVPIISPGTQKFPAACDNTIKTGGPGRISVVGQVVFRTKAFTIN